MIMSETKCVMPKDTSKEKEVDTRTQITPEDIDHRVRKEDANGVSDEEMEMEVTVINPDVESMKSRG